MSARETPTGNVVNHREPPRIKRLFDLIRCYRGKCGGFAWIREPARGRAAAKCEKVVSMRAALIAIIHVTGQPDQLCGRQPSLFEQFATCCCLRGIAGGNEAAGQAQAVPQGSVAIPGHRHHPPIGSHRLHQTETPQLDLPEIRDYLA